MLKELVKQHLKKSKIILLFKVIILLVLLSYICYFFKNKNHLSKYDGSETLFKGYIKEIELKDNKLTLIIKDKENLIVNYYFKENEKTKINYKIGDYVSINGKLSLPSENRNFHLFNYKNYLLTKKIFYILRADKIIKLKDNHNLLYKIKQKVIDRINHIPNNSYLKAFILGDSSNMDSDSLDSYRQNGISHLFAISGMHVTLLTSFILKILKKINKKTFINEYIVMLFLLIYMFMVDFSVSIIRASLMFIISKICKMLKIKIKTINVFLLVLIIILFINPFYLYSISFKYSFIISLYLIIFSNIINSSKSYFKKIFLTSFIAFLASIPIQINNFFSINILSVFLNLIFVPFFTFLIFPLSLITFVFPILINILSPLLNIFEIISKTCSNITFLTITLSCMSIYFVIYYYILITIILMFYEKKIYLILLLLTIFIHHNINYFKTYSNITMIDIGQGDSIFIRLKNGKGNILVDTGGIVNSNYSTVQKVVIPYLKSIGINYLDYLILSHGDYDHIGETINLINNFKVKNVLLNSGKDNELENNILNLIRKKKINYQKISEFSLNIKNYLFYFLNKKNIDDENKDSLIFMANIDNKNILFTGDATNSEEKYILDTYNIGKLDILKVGHHGSKTSTSEILLDMLQPKYAIISAGVNNRYSHPNKETINKLDKYNVKTFITSLNGMISIDLKQNIFIKTCLS